MDIKSACLGDDIENWRLYAFVNVNFDWGFEKVQPFLKSTRLVGVEGLLLQDFAFVCIGFAEVQSFLNCTKTSNSFWSKSVLNRILSGNSFWKRIHRTLSQFIVSPVCSFSIRLSFAC